MRARSRCGERREASRAGAFGSTLRPGHDRLAQTLRIRGVLGCGGEESGSDADNGDGDGDAGEEVTGEGEGCAFNFAN